ncbi:uncharacterized protein KGF55_002079 [Candida pseudojiufengensis]|uniref:uncharacterized protein n=1 Tax=Candida pseudojiufengensis TaxID=497109 RepID=UPI002224F10A|nr:uncharacterized protein KGF55_002079 [Candida pseudojiufengensis]KAI5964137.1 hypothetical protein KGF55_002079 [Candida pseudojiufengensis]
MSKDKELGIGHSEQRKFICGLLFSNPIKTEDVGDELEGVRYNAPNFNNDTTTGRGVEETFVHDEINTGDKYRTNSSFN